MVVGGSQQETLGPSFVLLGTRQQGVPVILRKMVLTDGFDPVSPSFTAHQRAPVLSILQVNLADGCQVARNLGPGFTVDYVQPPSNILALNIHILIVDETSGPSGLTGELLTSNLINTNPLKKNINIYRKNLTSLLNISLLKFDL
ncbi:hypothetical protein MS3_00000147 [Schistosoma haematobium]|uniref:Uncharacterized protein n=1 Tax=Schistosoma haematobium TaxID=6185 RepID=A0A922LLE0_SCHHA|nr:hypothetical protein MS3_00000147 [Schistosoma haematobium]KAH9588425.1 hypothetical protein MS3_00000147 [Schistosoma haematobium]